jgi:hypothetical protein
MNKTSDNPKNLADLSSKKEAPAVRSEWTEVVDRAIRDAHEKVSCAEDRADAQKSESAVPFLEEKAS